MFRFWLLGGCITMLLVAMPSTEAGIFNKKNKEDEERKFTGKESADMAIAGLKRSRE